MEKIFFELHVSCDDWSLLNNLLHGSNILKYTFVSRKKDVFSCQQSLHILNIFCQLLLQNMPMNKSDMMVFTHR